MPVYVVNVRRSIECDVEVEADTPEQAAEQVNNTAFPLPAQEEWSAIKDWWFQAGNEVHELER